MRARTAAVLAIALALGSSALGAQTPGRARTPSSAATPRAQLEARLRQRLWRLVKTRVGLDDGQMTRLVETNQRFDDRRRALAREERTARLALRGDMVADARADQNRIAASLDRVLQIQRERADLQIEEQRTLAAFMTPLQRARYAALQEQLRRRAETLQRRRATDGAPADTIP